MGCSGLLVLLDNMDLMVACYHGISSRHAREAWTQAFTIEVSMVTLKLRAMRNRWKLFLPFQEVMDVNFEEQLKRVNCWLKVLGEDVETNGDEDTYPGVELDNGYLLDMMGMEVEPIPGGLKPDELKLAVDDYCERVDKLLNKSDLSGWEDAAMDRLELEVRTLAESFKDEDGSLRLCISAIRKLAYELNELEEFFWSELKEQQFMVLANRLMYRDCQSAIKSAHDTVRKEHNSWPKSKERILARNMKERVKLQLLRDARGEELKEYIDLDYPALLDDACFGQYLFKARHELTTEEVQLMVKCCTMIVDLNQIIDPKLYLKKQRDQAIGRELDAEKKAIVKALLGFADMAEWRGGATADSIKLGIKRMLGVEFLLDDEMKDMSNDLWKLLLKRKNCDADKSLMVTWLNIVGYCVAHRMLSGGSPALCKQFFPKCSKDDYKAIDKGRSGEVVVFKKIEPLLDKYLK